MTTTADLNAAIKTTKSMLGSRSEFREGLRLLLEIRNLIFTPESPRSGTSLYGQLFQDLSHRDMQVRTNKKSRTIAYGIWHSTRIEDMTMNRLVMDRDQVFDSSNRHRTILDTARSTGNEWDGREILERSRRMDLDGLLAYQQEVWQATNRSIPELSFEDLSRKTDKNRLQGLLEDGSVGKHPDADWLVEFWGNKTVSGLLMMPMCRHHIVHLNESREAKP